MLRIIHVHLNYIIFTGKNNLFVRKKRPYTHKLNRFYRVNAKQSASVRIFFEIRCYVI